MAVTSILESGLLFEPGDEDWFRFECCSGFKPLKGLGVMEMDFGWYASKTQTPWLIELRDYSQSGNPEGLHSQQSLDYLIRECVEKAKDSLLLLGSVWYGLPKKVQLAPDLPAAFLRLPTSDRALKLAFVVKTDEPKSFLLATQALKDRLNGKLNGQRELLGIRDRCEVLLMDHQTAIGSGLPLRVADTFVSTSKKTAKKGKQSK